MNLVLFDLDNTLLAGDSDHSWGDFICQRGLVDADEYQARNDAFYADYCAGKLDVDGSGEYAKTRLSLLVPAIDASPVPPPPSRKASWR